MPTTNNLTSSSLQQLVYSDFTDNLLQAPFSNDLAKITNENSIKQSLRNIVKTYCGERLYDNSIGQSGNYGLFGLNDTLTESIVKQTLIDAIKNNEPRVNVAIINVDSQTNPNALVIEIFFNITNISNILSISVVLNRVR